MRAQQLPLNWLTAALRANQRVEVAFKWLTPRCSPEKTGLAAGAR